jgi:hypothetical protein
MPHEYQILEVLHMESSFQDPSFPDGFLLLTAILTLFSAFTPGNAHGELVTPHWILEGRLWLKVTLEEPVSIRYPVLIRGPRSPALCPFPQMQRDSFSGVLRTKSLYR